MKTLFTVELVLAVIAFVFGYGVLNQRVSALEEKSAIVQHMATDITEIKEDVSFIKGKLEGK